MPWLRKYRISNIDKEDHDNLDDLYKSMKDQIHSLKVEISELRGSIKDIDTKVSLDESKLPSSS